MKKRRINVHYYKNNRKVKNLIIKSRKDLDKRDWWNKCECLHTNNHGPDVVVDRNNNQSGSTFVICRNCDKHICINHVTDKDASDSIKRIDMMIDAIKMRIQLDRKEDVKIAGWLGDVQYHINHSLLPLYAATRINKQKYASTEPGISGTVNTSRIRR